MIANDQELQTTVERIGWFQKQLAHLRQTETNALNYRAAASGFLAELDRMQLEVREYFSTPPGERPEAAWPRSFTSVRLKRRRSRRRRWRDKVAHSCALRP